jgi:hypothetical protein
MKSKLFGFDTMPQNEFGHDVQQMSRKWCANISALAARDMYTVTASTAENAL